MKKNAHLIVCICLGCLFCACSQKPAEEPVPVEEVVISTPPEYEVPAPPKPTIGEDGVWLADDELLYGMAQPVGREILSCDPHRLCDFVVHMDYHQVRAFLGKYFPYQKYKYYKAVDVFEILPELKDQYKDGGIVPTFDPKIRRPEPGQEGKIVISWIRKYNAYVWHYTSAFAINEAKENERRQLEEQEREAAELAQRILDKGTYAGLTNDDYHVLIRYDLTPSDDTPLTAEDRAHLQELIDHVKQREAHTADSGIVPSLKPIEALPTIQAPKPAPEATEADDIEKAASQHRNLLPDSTGEPASNAASETPSAPPRPASKGVNLLPAILQKDDAPADPSSAEASP